MNHLKFVGLVCCVLLIGISVGCSSASFSKGDPAVDSVVIGVMVPVVLEGQEPQHPTQGEEYSITANGGSPQYTFTWYLDGEPQGDPVTQRSNTFEIDVPAGSAGKMLKVEVVDGSSDFASKEQRIVVKTPG